MGYSIMAGINRAGGIELVFECSRCLERVVAVRGDDGAASRVKPGESAYIGGVAPEDAVAAAEYLAHECDPARVIPSLAGV